LKDKGELMLNDKQSDYIKKWKSKNPEYKSIPDTTLYAKIITKFPDAQEKYGNIGDKSALRRFAEFPLNIAKTTADTILDTAYTYKDRMDATK
jgi:hypothetical protein